MGGLSSKSQEPEAYFRAQENIQIISSSKTSELDKLTLKYNSHIFEFRKYANGKTYMIHPIKGSYCARRLADYRAAMTRLTHLNNWEIPTVPLSPVVDADIWPDHDRRAYKEIRFNLLGMNQSFMKKTINALTLCAMNTSVDLGPLTRQMQIILSLTEEQYLEFQSHCNLNHDLNIHWKDHSKN
jgi:hypothetical protein